MSRNKGFTLIELIIVIALIAILATTVILVINPVKIFQEARDSQRIADLGQMNSALSLYASTASTSSLGTTNSCYVYVGSGVNSAAVTTALNTGGTCQLRYTAVVNTLVTSSAQTASSTTSWVPVNLSLVSGGQPLSAWPVDPKAGTSGSFTTATSTAFYYSYTPNNANSTWELNAHMESTRYQNGGGDDVETTDGGDKPFLLEIGTAVNL